MYSLDIQNLKLQRSSDNNCRNFQGPVVEILILSRVPCLYRQQRKYRSSLVDKFCKNSTNIVSISKYYIYYIILQICMCD